MSEQNILATVCGVNITDADVDATNLAAGLNIPAKVTLNPFLLGFGVGIRL